MDTKGLGAAVAAAMEDGDGAVIGAAVQLPLLPADQVAGLPEDPVERRQALQQAGRGRGRPKGASNKTTTAWRDFILARYPSPLVVLAETYSRRTEDLAAELGCNKADAFGIQMRAAAELAPYLHGKAPVEVQVQANLPMISLADPAAFVVAAAVAAPSLADLLPIGDAVENQCISQAAAVTVGMHKLEDGAKDKQPCGFATPEPLIKDQPHGAAHPKADE